MFDRLKRKVRATVKRLVPPTAEALAESRQLLASLLRSAEVAAGPGGGDSPDVPENAIEAIVAGAVRRYGHELEGVRGWARMRNEPAFFPQTGMYDWVEAQVLYLVIRAIRPEVIAEISPNYGYSTGFILLALNRNQSGRLLSFDLDDRFIKRARKSFATVGIDDSHQSFFPGDVRRTYEAALPERVSLLFMDSDHSAPFAKWYLEALYPRLAPGGLMHVHDVLRYGVQPHPGDEGEGKVIWDFLERTKVPESQFLYVSELVRNQPRKPEALRRLERYPFGTRPVATNNVEQSASLWVKKTA